jgi:hypothetical protein
MRYVGERDELRIVEAAGHAANGAPIVGVVVRVGVRGFFVITGGLGRRLPFAIHDEVRIRRQGFGEPGDYQQRRAALDFGVAGLDLDLEVRSQNRVVRWTCRGTRAAAGGRFPRQHDARGDERSERRQVRGLREAQSAAGGHVAPVVLPTVADGAAHHGGLQVAEALEARRGRLLQRGQ